MKKVSDICLAKIKEFEGLRKEAYYDVAGVPTIGYGHTHGVRMGDVISEYWADMFLKADLFDIENQVNSLGEFNQPQFDALVSFAFNLGFYKLKTSTLLKTIQEGGSMHAIKKEFKRWVYAGGKKLKGLERRREWEAKRFFEPDEMEPMKVRDWSDFHKTTKK
jgi:lysozyme